MKILNIVGARPNFMKVAPLHNTFCKHSFIESKIVHTGQHYDSRMSDIFFNQLALPKPDYYLGIGSGTHTQVTAKIMTEFEKIVLAEMPDVILVVGDVNSTLACALVAVKMKIPLVHVEAGLRSGDRTMPEEINRIITDSIADLLFVTEESGMTHLANEGIPAKKVHFVGNVMIDSLCKYREQAKNIPLLKKVNLSAGEYILMTMHRPDNVDNYASLSTMIKIIKKATKYKKVIFPMHPRTQNNLERFDLYKTIENIPDLIILEPQGYLEFLHLMDNSSLIITDSGGIQEESTFLKVPCLTLRTSTERPITIKLGTNILIDELNEVKIENVIKAILGGQTKKGTTPPLWDGKAAERIVNHIIHWFENIKTTATILEIN